MEEEREGKKEDEGKGRRQREVGGEEKRVRQEMTEQ